MGLYGSPDLSKKYGNIEEYQKQQIKKERQSPQTNVWVWIVIFIVNIYNLIFMGIRVDSVLTILIMDCLIMTIVSILSLICNFINKNKLKSDLIFILLFIGMFFILILILGFIQ